MCVCVAEAKGKKSVAQTELEANYKPSVKASRYDANVAKADSNYSVAIEKCDDKAGNDNFCVFATESVMKHPKIFSEVDNTRFDRVPNYINTIFTGRLSD
jgi:hypothetical protein